MFMLFIPITALILYARGVNIIYHQVNIIFVFFLYGVSILYLIVNKRDPILLYIPIILFVVFATSFLGSFNNIFTENKFNNFFGLFISLTSPPIISIFLLKHFRKTGNINLFFIFFFYSGIFISIVNIFLFFLLYFGDYSLVFSYTDFLGLGSYIEDLGTFFIRPAGYFFDYHSQYFIPIISLFIVLYNKVKLTKKTRGLVILIIISGILLSGIKSGYLTLFICLFYLMISRINIITLFKFILGILVIINITNLFLDNFIYELAYKIITHDIEIIIQHVVEVPVLLFKNYFMVLLFGGQVDFQKYIYSEVYYVTMIYYIGFFGVFTLFIFPILYTFIRSKDNFIKTITLIFSLSLFHYYVFKISINIIGAALFYFYFFKKYLLKLNE
jgi:hypothetical protein